VDIELVRGYAEGAEAGALPSCSLEYQVLTGEIPGEILSRRGSGDSVAIVIEHIAFDERVGPVEHSDAVTFTPTVQVVMNEIIVNPYRTRIVAANAPFQAFFIDLNCATAPAGDFHIGDLDPDVVIDPDTVWLVAVAIHNAEIRTVQAKPFNPDVV